MFDITLLLFDHIIVLSVVGRNFSSFSRPSCLHVLLKAAKKSQHAFVMFVHRFGSLPILFEALHET